MTSTLAAAVAHDVKNRLVILGEELSRLSALTLSGQARSHVSAASEQARQLSARLVEWLTVQKAADEGGLRAITHEEMPELFLDDVLAQARHLAGTRIDLVKEVDEELPLLWFFDRQLVRLALDSALHNALRFARARITLGARVEGAMLCFSVHDDGPGLQHDAGAAATSTGLGTVLCREVARAHRNRGLSGHCALGDHENGGALFELRLP